MRIVVTPVDLIYHSGVMCACANNAQDVEFLHVRTHLPHMFSSFSSSLPCVCACANNVSGRRVPLVDQVQVHHQLRGRRDAEPLRALRHSLFDVPVGRLQEHQHLRRQGELLPTVSAWPTVRGGSCDYIQELLIEAGQLTLDYARTVKTSRADFEWSAAALSGIYNTT